MTLVGDGSVWRGSVEAGRRRRVWAAAAALATALAVGATVAGFAAFVRLLPNHAISPPSRADGIVALTGGSNRIERALALLAEGYAPRLLITGVGGRTSRDEIERLLPERAAWVRCCVDLGYAARDTVGNAAEIRGWARERGVRSLIVVTSDYHLPRALTEIGHALPGVRTAPVPVAPDGGGREGGPGSLARARLLLSEYAKFVAAWLRTRFPSPVRTEERTLAEGVPR